MSSVAPATDRPYISALTGLRFVAAASVLIEHFPQIIPGVSEERLSQGGAGVSLFFVLSGFVLIFTYGERMSLPGADRRRYLVRRFARIVPLHLLALALVAVIVLIRTDPVGEHGLILTVISFLTNLVLVHPWVPAQVLDLWNGPAWSIAAELFFYVSFPFLVPAFIWPMLRKRRLPQAIVAVLVLELVAFLALCWVAGTVLLSRGNDPESVRLVVGRLGQFPAVRLGEFVAGCLLGALYLYRDDNGQSAFNRALTSPRGRNGLLALTGVGYVLAQLTPRYLDGTFHTEGSSVWSTIDLRTFAVYLPFSVLAVAGVAWGDSVVSRFLRRPTMVRLGEASYALYVIQWTAWLIINDRAIGVPGPGLAAAAIVACVAASLVLHRYVETPARHWVVRRLDPPADRPSTPQPARSGGRP